MERRTFSIAVLASLLPAALWARVDESATVVSYETHRGWRVWDCTHRNEILNVRWADCVRSQFAWLDKPVRIDRERGEVIENVEQVGAIVFVYSARLVLLDPRDGPVAEANRAIARMAAQAGGFINVRLPAHFAAFDGAAPRYTTSVVLVR